VGSVDSAGSDATPASASPSPSRRAGSTSSSIASIRQPCPTTLGALIAPAISPWSARPLPVRASPPLTVLIYRCGPSEDAIWGCRVAESSFPWTEDLRPIAESAQHDRARVRRTFGVGTRLDEKRACRISFIPALLARPAAGAFVTSQQGRTATGLRPGPSSRKAVQSLSSGTLSS